MNPETGADGMSGLDHHQAVRTTVAGRQLRASPPPQSQTDFVVPGPPC